MSNMGWQIPPLAVFGSNVRDYGAVGDGVTNDATAIQAAITAVSARGGGVVRFPVGTYAVATRISLLSKVSLAGEGQRTTTIKALSGVATAVLTGLGASTASDLTISDMTIDGNASALTGNVCGIQVSTGARVNIERVRITNVRDIGINFLTVPDSVIHLCEIDDIGNGGANGHGINAVNGSHRLRVHRNTLNIGSPAAGMGIRVGEDGNGSTDCVISENHVDQTGAGLECVGITPTCLRVRVANNVALNGRDNGISVSPADSTVTGNVAVGANFHGIQLNGNNSTCTGNVCKNNNQNVAATRGGIHLNNVSGCVVTGNRCYDDQGEKTQEYGVKGSGAEGINLVEANVLDGNKTAATGNLHVNVVVRNNTGS